MFEPFTYLLVPVDFSEYSLHALQLADTLAKGLGAEMHLVHVVERTPYEFYAAEGFISGVPVFPIVNGKVIDMAYIESEMNVQLAKLAAEKRGGPCTYEVRTGHPVAEILAAAKERECSAIVICTHGRTGLSHLVMGSVAEKVVRLSPIPVVSIRAKGLKD